MKKELFKTLGCYAFLGTIVSNEIVDPDFVPNDSEMMNILNEIFSVDEQTGLPKGDLAYFLSPDGNPSVKAWLENNLLKPRFGVKQHNEDITDDMLVEYSRKDDESVMDYATRLASLRDDAVAQYQKNMESVEFQK